MGSVYRAISLAVGIIGGGVFGVYLSQTYQLPDVKKFGNEVINKADEYAKDGDENTQNSSKK